MKFAPLNNPILFVSDNPSGTGGLARVCRDLACLAATLPEFRVGVLGRGVGQNRRLPFLIYDYPEEMQWGEQYIQSAWEDFSAGEPGVIITLDDLSRRHWMVNPVGLPEELQKFLGPGRNFRRWAYVPLDSTGPNGKQLSVAGTDCLLRFDRVLAASRWGCEVMQASGRKDADWLPHGIWADQFHIYEDARRMLGWGKTDVWVGAVMANQARKDYPAAFECWAVLKHHYGNRFRAWLHTDAMIRYWNIYALAADYGVRDSLEVTTGLEDRALAVRYSACDCTVHPSGGEGFGLPIAESLLCGTPAVVTEYAAGPELVEEACRVKPVTYRVDTQHNVLRAVLSGYAFAAAAMGQIEAKQQDWSYRSQQLNDSASHLDWSKLKHLWTRWLLNGLKEGR